MNIPTTPSERSSLLQQLINREVKASYCDYRTAFERVAKENPELMAAMHVSEVNRTREAYPQGGGKNASLGGGGTTGGGSTYPKNSQAPPQIKTLRAAGSKI